MSYYYQETIVYQTVQTYNPQHTNQAQFYPINQLNQIHSIKQINQINVIGKQLRVKQLS